MERVCSTCGNESADRGRCPFCGSFQTTASRPQARIMTIDLERGRPPVEEALRVLERDVAAARMRGVRLIRIIHGWGSSGSGGHIRDAVRKVLAGYVRARRVRRFVSGEEYSEDTASGRELMAAHAALRQSLRTDRDNPGITFVEM